ncbi:calcium-binding protein [Oceanicella sp. SM1341]|uniref:calcium-binding protein n=1 Tax=Oceanicella sp. SM1341 TaxID=1548889 RepID=UPI000E4BC18C|nr:calcium-binding protein [Oceanicella sp. SM1341]
MTITITLENNDGIDLDAYFAAFDSTFTLSGFGAFSNGFSGAYMGSTESVTATPDMAAQAFYVDGDLEYTFASHTVDGTISSISFGYGGYQSGASLALAQTDISLAFSAPLDSDSGDDVQGLVYDLMSDGTPPAGNTSTLREMLSEERMDVWGSYGDDVVTGSDTADVIRGRGGDDMIYGGGGNDRLLGNNGDDWLYGGAGRDWLFGGEGNDLLFGGAGRDVLYGGAGDDRLAGGGNADLFVFDTLDTGNDRIVDFNAEVGDVVAYEAGQFTDFADLQDSMYQRGDNTVILDDHGNRLVLVGVEADTLTADSFSFG